MWSRWPRPAWPSSWPPCGGDSEPGGGGGEESQGETVYSANCARCHGPDGEGGVGPQLGDGAVEANLTLEEHTEVVTDGRNGMPAWEGQLSPEEIDAVVQYEARRARSVAPFLSDPLRRVRSIAR